MSNDLELLKSGGYCFCVKYNNENKDALISYLKENKYKIFHPSSSLPRYPCFYINYDTKICASGIIGIMVLKPIGNCMIDVNDFFNIVSIFDKKK